MDIAGVKNSLELEDMLLLSSAVDSVCFARMGSPRFACRFNILAPRMYGKKDPKLLKELFYRLERFARLVAGGGTYDAVLAQTGLPRIGQTIIKKESKSYETTHSFQPVFEGY